MASESCYVWIATKSQTVARSFRDCYGTLGLRRCKSDSNLYCHKSRSLYVLADVGDLLIVGDAKLEKEFIDALSKVH